MSSRDSSSRLETPKTMLLELLRPLEMMENMLPVTIKFSQFEMERSVRFSGKGQDPRHLCDRLQHLLGEGAVKWLGGCEGKRANQRPVFRSRDLSGPITSQYFRTRRILTLTQLRKALSSPPQRPKSWTKKWDGQKKPRHSRPAERCRQVIWRSLEKWKPTQFKMSPTQRSQRVKRRGSWWEGWSSETPTQPRCNQHSASDHHGGLSVCLELSITG